MKKIVSVLLAAMMILSLAVVAFAAERPKFEGQPEPVHNIFDDAEDQEAAFYAAKASQDPDQGPFTPSIYDAPEMPVIPPETAYVLPSGSDIATIQVEAKYVNGINSAEEVLYAKFCANVDVYGYLSPAHAAQFKGEALNALMKVDLDSQVCNDLSTGIDAVMGFAAARGIDTIAEAKAAIPAIMSLVNSFANKYGMSVAISAQGFVTVCIGADAPCAQYTACTKDGKVIACVDKVSNAACTSIVKQTGMDLTVTFAVAALIAISLVFGLVVVSKKQLLANN